MDADIVLPLDAGAQWVAELVAVAQVAVAALAAGKAARPALPRRR